MVQLVTVDAVGDRRQQPDHVGYELEKSQICSFRTYAKHSTNGSPPLRTQNCRLSRLRQLITYLPAHQQRLPLIHNFIILEMISH